MRKSSLPAVNLVAVSRECIHQYIDLVQEVIIGLPKNFVVLGGTLRIH